MKKFSKMLAASVVSVFVLGLVNCSQSEVKKDQPFTQFQQWAISHQDVVAGEKLSKIGAAATGVKKSLGNAFKRKDGNAINKYGGELTAIEKANAINHIKDQLTNQKVVAYDKDNAYWQLIDEKAASLELGKDFHDKIVILDENFKDDRNQTHILGFADAKGEISPEKGIYVTKSFLFGLFVHKKDSWNKVALHKEARQDNVTLVLEQFLKHEKFHIDHPNAKEEEVEKVCPTGDVRAFVLARESKDHIDKFFLTDEGKKVSGKAEAELKASEEGLSEEQKRKEVHVVVSKEVFTNPQALAVALRGLGVMANSGVNYILDVAVKNDEEKKDIENSLAYLDVSVGFLDQLKIDGKVVTSEDPLEQVKDVVKAVRGIKAEAVVSVAFGAALSKEQQEALKLQKVSVACLTKNLEGVEVVPWSTLLLEAAKGGLSLQKGAEALIIAVAPIVLPEAILTQLKASKAEWDRIQSLKVKA